MMFSLHIVGSIILSFQNDELKDVVKKMLDNANLEQVTMKTVLKDVSLA